MPGRAGLRVWEQLDPARVQERPRGGVGDEERHLHHVLGSEPGGVEDGAEVGVDLPDLVLEIGRALAGGGIGTADAAGDEQAVLLDGQGDGLSAVAQPRYGDDSPGHQASIVS